MLMIINFYNIYGGTQDNNTQGASSRTDNIHGIETQIGLLFWKWTSTNI